MKTEQELLNEFISNRYKSHELIHDDPYFRQLVRKSMGFNSHMANYKMGIAMGPFKNRLQKYFDVIIKLIQSWKIN